MGEDLQNVIAVPQTQIQPETPESRITISYMSRNVSALPVLESELDGLGSIQNSLNAAIFGIAFGVLVAISITLTTVRIEDVYTHATYWLCFWGSLGAAVYFLIRTIGDRKKAKQQIATIKQQAAQK